MGVGACSKYLKYLFLQLNIIMITPTHAIETIYDIGLLTMIAIYKYMGKRGI